MIKKLDVYNLSSYNVAALITKDMFEILSNLKKKTKLSINGLSLDNSDTGEWRVSCDELKDVVNFGINTDDYVEQELGYAFYIYEKKLTEFIKDDLIEDSMGTDGFKDLFFNMDIMNQKVYILEIESDDITLDNLEPYKVLVSALTRNLEILTKEEKAVLNYVSAKLLLEINYTPKLIIKKSKVRFKITRTMYDELRQSIIWRMNRTSLDGIDNAAGRIDEFSYGSDGMVLIKYLIDCSKLIFEISKNKTEYFIDVFNLDYDDYGEEVMTIAGRKDLIRFINYLRYDLLYDEHIAYLLNRLADAVG